MAARDMRGQTPLSDIELEQSLARKALDRGMFWRMLPLLRPVKGLVGAVVGLEVLLVLAVFLRPWFVGQAIDHGLVRAGTGWQVDVPLVTWLAAGLAATWVVRFGLSGLSQYLAGRAALQVLNQLRMAVYRHVQALSVRFFDKTKAGRIISRVDRDVDGLEPLLIQGPPELLSAVLRCSVASVLMWHIAPMLFAALAAVVPLLVLGIWAFKRISQRNWGKVAEARARFTAHLVEGKRLALPAFRAADVGALLGVLAAFARGRTDQAIVWSADVFLAFPDLILVLLIVSMLGRSHGIVVLTVALAFVPGVIRLARGIALNIVKQEFVEVAQLLGYSRTHILLREILPNIATPLLVHLGVMLTWAVGMLSGLAFLGYGVAPPAADWGLMINENRAGLLVQPLAVAAPALLIALFALGTNLLAEAAGRIAARIEER